MPAPWAIQFLGNRYLYNIRTIVLRAGCLCSGRRGIVADSDPTKEHEETCNKPAP